MQVPNAAAEAPRFIQWPGKGANRRHAVEKSATNVDLRVEAEPHDATIDWFWVDEGAPNAIPLDGEMNLSADRRKLTIASMKPEYFSKTWRVRASHNGKTAEEDFRLVEKAAEKKADEPKPELGEWDSTWAIVVGIVAFFVALVFGIAAWVTLGDAAPDHLAAHAVAALLAAGGIALAAAVVAALIEIRGRMRAKQAVADSLARGGLPTDLIPDATEFVKAFGTLREVAALAVTSMALFAGAFVLAWEKFPDAEASTATQPPGLTVQAKVAGSGSCTLAFISQGRPATEVAPGTYTVNLRDPGPKVRVTLRRENTVVMSSSRLGHGRTSAQIELATGTYSARCNRQGRPATVKDLRVADD